LEVTNMTDTKTVTASLTFRGQTLENVPVLNPGAWWGKCWLVEIGLGYSSSFYVVEADSMSDAIDEFADDEKWGHNIRVDNSDLEDYPEEDRYHAGNDGAVVDLDHVMVYPLIRKKGTGEHLSSLRYHADHLPRAGCKPTDYDDEGKRAYWEIIREYISSRFAGDTLLATLCRYVADNLETMNGGTGGQAQSWEEYDNIFAAPAALADLLLERGGGGR
jgi:hypothetical protein